MLKKFYFQARDDLILKGRKMAIVSQTKIGTVSKTTLGKLLGDGMEQTWALPSAQIPSRVDLN